ILLSPPPRTTLFPYTTLFRSGWRLRLGRSTCNGKRASRQGNAIPPIRPDSFSGADLREPIPDFQSIIFRSSRSFGALFIFAFGSDRKSTRLNSSHDQISYAVF